MFLPNFWGTQNEESFLENFGEPKMKKILKTWGTQKGDQGNPKGKFPCLMSVLMLKHLIPSAPLSFIKALSP